MTEVVSNEERQWALWANLGGLLALAGIPFANLVGSIVVYAKAHGTDMPFAREHARRALNFQITYSLVVMLLLVVLFVSWMPFFVSIASLPPQSDEPPPPWFFAGFAWFGMSVALLVVLQFANVICSALGAVAASSGRIFRYWAIPFVGS